MSSTSVWHEFRQFIARGNVVDLAVGVIIGAAFGRIVTDIVEGIVMPPIGVLLGRIDFSSLFYVLSTAKGIPVSLADAKAKGVPVIAYGQLVNDVISFLVIAAVVFLLVRQVNAIKAAVENAVEPPPPSMAPTSKECPYCLSMIPLKATRCPHCTSQI
jgi:large conductance mechanosensitive channel